MLKERPKLPYIEIAPRINHVVQSGRYFINTSAWKNNNKYTNQFVLYKWPYEGSRLTSYLPSMHWQVSDRLAEEAMVLSNVCTPYQLHQNSKQWEPKWSNPWLHYILVIPPWKARHNIYTSYSHLDFIYRAKWHCIWQFQCFAILFGQGRDFQSLRTCLKYLTHQEG